MTEEGVDADRERWVRATEGQVSTELEDEVVILDVEEGTYFGVEGVAAWIWQRIQDPVPMGDLVEGLVETYNVEPGRCRPDLEAFLGSLEKRGLVEVTDGPPE